MKGTLTRSEPNSREAEEVGHLPEVGVGGEPERHLAAERAYRLVLHHLGGLHTHALSAARLETRSGARPQRASAYLPE